MLAILAEGTNRALASQQAFLRGSIPIAVKQAGHLITTHYRSLLPIFYILLIKRTQASTAVTGRILGRGLPQVSILSESDAVGQFWHCLDKNWSTVVVGLALALREKS